MEASEWTLSVVVQTVGVGVTALSVVVAVGTFLVTSRRDRKRQAEDRRGLAIEALTRYLVGLTKITMHRPFASGKTSEAVGGMELIARAYRLLDPEDQVIAEWALQQGVKILKAIPRVQRATIWAPAHQRELEKAGRIAGESIGRLQSWHQRELPTSWFATQLEQHKNTAP